MVELEPGAGNNDVSLSGSNLSETSQPATDPIELFQTFPFDTDDAFQAGLSSILADPGLQDQSEEERSGTILRAQAFYFNRMTGHNLSPDEVVNRRIVNRRNQTDVAPAEEQHTLSFAELKELIEQGKMDRIPNNRHIPNILNDAPPSESRASVRKKPWEQ